jgi:hypothetical protein
MLLRLGRDNSYDVARHWGHSLRRPLTGLVYQPRMVHEYGAFDGMRFGEGNLGALAAVLTLVSLTKQYCSRRRNRDN